MQLIKEIKVELLLRVLSSVRLERRTVNANVTGSNPVGYAIWGFARVGELGRAVTPLRLR